MRALSRGDTRRAARAVAKLMGADPDDPDVRAGATLVALTMLKILRPDVRLNTDL